MNIRRHVSKAILLLHSSKRKKGKYEEKKIPITPVLRPYIYDYVSGQTKLPCRNEVLLRHNFNKILPEHTLKDLRKTFNTRCIECKVDFFARKKFMGHSVGKLDKTYTGNLDDFLLAEGEKLNQWYTLYPKNTPKNDD